MTITELRDAVAANADLALQIEFSAGHRLAPHFHVTEVGRVEKDFVDCGGVRRRETRCVLQTLVAGDVDHRLTSTKLAGILSLADKLELPDNAQVEVEHQERSVSVDLVEAVERRGDELVIRLQPKQTACLAEDACGITPTQTGEALPTLAVVDGCCSGQGRC